MHLYPPQESVICLDFVASSQGRDGLDTEEVTSNHIFGNKNWKKSIQTIFKTQSTTQIIDYEYKVFNENQKCSETEQGGTNRLDKGSAVSNSILNPTFNQKVEGCKDQCNNLQDCRFFFIRYAPNENFCSFYKACDVMVPNNIPGIIFEKQVKGTINFSYYLQYEFLQNYIGLDILSIRCICYFFQKSYKIQGNVAGNNVKMIRRPSDPRVHVSFVAQKAFVAVVLEIR